MHLRHRCRSLGFYMWLALSLLGLFACGSSDAKSPAAKREKPLHLRFVSGADTNGGTALHVLVRKTTKIDYPRQDYDDVAKSLLLESDPATLEWLVVSPNRVHDVAVKRPSDAQVGVYFLFSEPGARWRHLVEDDSVEYVQFQVGRDQIRETLVRAPAAASTGKSRR